MGVMVVAPDDFAYPENTAMGKMRHKDLLPLKKAHDNVDYWEGDLMYSSGSEGTHTYSTKAEGVLDDPDHYRDLYQRCYELRRSELHFIIERLPLWVKTMGFFLGGTSEGGMTIARFDDHRYGEMVCGRFINSFSVEYCYFTPTPEAGQIGGQLDVPTLNIIGTKDQYFGAEDSVAKIVAEDEDTGYGSKDLTGNAYNTLVKQRVENALVCVLEGGVHSPCKTHDNFLRQLFNTFFSRPGSIWQLDAIWTPDETRRELIEVKQSTIGDRSRKINVVQLFVPRMKFPQQVSLRWVEDMRRMSANDQALKEQMEKEEGEIASEQSQVQKMLNKVRARAKSNEVAFKASSPAKESFYTNDKVLKVKPGHYLKHGL
uniref:Uncharacterized protein n=1 Tax=Pyrodinium bahamense TaxID=73915 RepID=A0A6T9AMD6_9DINO